MSGMSDYLLYLGIFGFEVLSISENGINVDIWSMTLNSRPNPFSWPRTIRVQVMLQVVLLTLSN